ncbi:MAG: C4-type zinc ribbon domain-containing protein [Candidatus Hydrogenedentes bacterium]|nr:C4-type zinc ribbon domain-containing protein [Candidatus Hydrogenedentota bacterium]
MREHIRSLLKLQEVDLRIEELKAKEEVIPKQKERLLLQEKKLEQEIEEHEKNYKRLQLAQREKEKEIAYLQEQVKRLDSQLMSVKKNEEYRAMLKEIEDVKKQIGLKEEELINIMYQIDEANLFFLESKKRIEQEIKSLKEQAGEIDKELEEIKREREEWESKRNTIVNTVEPEFIERYERIRKRVKVGPVVVALEPSKDICTGCYMKQLPQVVNEIIGWEKIHTCRHCGRILYYSETLNEDTSFALDKS